MVRNHLVVVIPGIGGSNLVGARGRDVWSANVHSIAELIRKPDELSVDEHAELTPRGLIKTVKLFGAWTAIPGYDSLLKELGGLGGAVLDDGSGPRVRGANVVAFAYDFRLGVTHAAERLDGFIRDRLNDLWPQKPGEGSDPQRGRVLIVAHSMGGLIARLWAGQEANRDLCRAMMTLGTPHRGAPKALDVLVNGLAVAGLTHIRPAKTLSVLRGWQSMYDLLPRFPLVSDLSSLVEEPGQEQLRPHELPADWLPGDWRSDKADAAWAMHHEIQRCWDAMPPQGPAVVPRIGYGHGTLRKATWNGRRLKVTRNGFPGEDLEAWDVDRGDGTVPAVSGLPVEMNDDVPVNLLHPLRHGPIGALTEAATWVQAFERRPRIAGFERAEANPGPSVVVGVDVEPLAVAGSPIELTARILGSPAPVSGVALFATASGLVNAVEMVWDEHDAGFRATLPALAPGRYEVTVLADSIPRHGAARTSDVIEVVADEDLD